MAGLPGAMTREEIGQLLAACAPHRRLLYKTAFQSGLRVSELRNLTVNDLDANHSGLHLDSAWTKNRRSGFQPLPRALVQRLQEFTDSGEAALLYSRFYRQGDDRQRIPTEPLLYVPSHPARDLDLDLRAAGINKHGPGGKIDFHACRLAYINFVLEAGASVKEAQTLARHSTPEMTLNVYGRVREERLADAVERVAADLQPSDDLHRVPSVHRKAVGAEQEYATPSVGKGCASSQLVEAAGIEPASENDPTQISYVRSQSTISSPVVPTDRILKELVQ